MESTNNIPDIFYDGNKLNPCIASPNAPYAIFFYQTRETLFGDADIFKRFIDNAINQFRNTDFYTQYKGFLFKLGMDRCQIMGNITEEMVGSKGIEMHHNGITIFDIAVIICNHILNVKGKVCTFDIIHELRKVHKNNQVPLVMLCKTMHQMYHNEEEFVIPASMCFGNWMSLIYEYIDGLTYGIAKKLFYWIKISQEHTNDENLNSELIKVRNKILEWSDKNECSFNNNKYNCNFIPGGNTNNFQQNY